jgi:hypothetical protein
LSALDLKIRLFETLYLKYREYLDSLGFPKDYSFSLLLDDVILCDKEHAPVTNATINHIMTSHFYKNDPKTNLPNGQFKTNAKPILFLLQLTDKWYREFRVWQQDTEVSIGIAALSTAPSTSAGPTRKLSGRLRKCRYTQVLDDSGNELAEALDDPKLDLTCATKKTVRLIIVTQLLLIVFQKTTTVVDSLRNHFDLTQEVRTLCFLTSCDFG